MYSENDGNNALVPLCYPRGIAVDIAGSVYICESRLVRKVTSTVVAPSTAVIQAPSVTPVSTRTVYPTAPTHLPTSKPAATASALPGIITTVAGKRGSAEISVVDGSTATAATLDDTRGVAVDLVGNLFITTYGTRILKVTASSGILTVVAGTGRGSFSGDGGLATYATLLTPLGIALDKSGNIFVAERYNHRIRKITVGTGIITTVAGDGKSNSPGVDNVAATRSALNTPTDVAVDTFGNIYITDSGNGRVRRVTASTGIITTIGGNEKAYVPGYLHCQR